MKYFVGKMFDFLPMCSKVVFVTSLVVTDC